MCAACGRQESPRAVRKEDANAALRKINQGLWRFSCENT